MAWSTAGYLVLGFLVLATLPSLGRRSASPEASGRSITLWAWERPESLRFLPTESIGVAVLVGTLDLVPDRVVAHPRLQPLELPRAARLTAVVRIESAPGRPLGKAHRRQAVEAIHAWSTAPPGFSELQIDFDAVVSERAFYRALLEDLRHALPAAMTLSITALASWCLGDTWLSGLPIREAVPMLFRMGIDDEAVRGALARGRDFQEPLCRGSYGLSTDEPLPVLDAGRRLYLFHPRPWTEEALLDFRRQLAVEAPAGSQS